MCYVILITPEDKIEVKEYKDYHTINELVDGWYELCGWFVIADKMWMLFCNEEFLFQDNCAFNSVGTALAGQPIYGNVVVTLDGYNVDNERDSLPMSCAEANDICTILNDMRTFIAPTLDELNVKFKDEKPSPQYEAVTMTEEEFFKALGIDDD